MLVSIVSNPTFALAVFDEVYSNFPSSLRRRSLPVSLLATYSWKPPRTCPMRGVTTHVYAPKSNTDWTMY